MGKSVTDPPKILLKSYIIGTHSGSNPQFFAKLRNWGKMDILNRRFLKEEK
jgi:hypothetical protein